MVTGLVLPTPRRLSPLIVGCLAATWLIWGSTYLAIRFALAGFPPYFLMATRFVCAGALLMGWQMARGSRNHTPFEPARTRFQTVGCSRGSAIHIIL